MNGISVSEKKKKSSQKKKKKNPHKWRVILVSPSIVWSNVCYTMLGIRCVGACVGASQRISLSVFAAKPTQRICARDLPRHRKDEGRKARERTEGKSQQKGASESSRHERAAKRRRQQKGAEETSRQNWSVREMRVGQRGDQSTEVIKTAARTCWPTDAGWTNARS